MLGSRPAHGRWEKPVTIRSAGALSVGLLGVLIQASACAPVKGPSSEAVERRAVEPEPPREETTPRVETPKAPASPAPAEPPRPKTVEPPRPKPEPPRAQESAPPPPTTPARAPVLDLTSLENRLRETSAIGVFTKLSLKNQVDDLLERFRTFHEGRGGTTLAKLREGYDLLVLKVMSLLQDKDPALARDISTSREALWNILADPAKFKNL